MRPSCSSPTPRRTIPRQSGTSPLEWRWRRTANRRWAIEAHDTARARTSRILSSATTPFRLKLAILYSMTLGDIAQGIQHVDKAMNRGGIHQPQAAAMITVFLSRPRTDLKKRSVQGRSPRGGGGIERDGRYGEGGSPTTRGSSGRWRGFPLGT
jgi:uncharacterized membrane protein YgcG